MQRKYCKNCVTEKNFYNYKRNTVKIATEKKFYKIRENTVKIA